MQHLLILKNAVFALSVLTSLVCAIPAEADTYSESQASSDGTSSSSCSYSSVPGASSGACATAYVNPTEPDTIFDFVIIGAGPAGCILANRLTEIAEWNVLLIEAGGDANPIMDIPFTTNHLQLAYTNWKYRGEPTGKACLASEQGRCIFPAGKVIGGSSVIDYMIYCRGNPADFDNWEANGNTGWGYEDVLPYFLKSENTRIPELMEDEENHATDGPVYVSYSSYHTPLAEAFIEAGYESGLNYVDYNSGKQTGVSYIQTTTNNGTRWSAKRAYIDPIKDRKNLFIQDRSTVTKIIIEDKVAKGVEFIHENKKYVVYVSKEVIVAAGVVNSAQLLMVSGIGPKDHLEEKGIEVIQDLPVGCNLQDHVTTGALLFKIDGNEATRTEDVLLEPENYVKYNVYHTGPLTMPGGLEGLAFFNTDSNDCNSTYDNPNVMLLFGSVSLVSDPTHRVSLSIDCDTFNAVYKPIEELYTYTMFPILMNSKSKGKILLKNADPSEPALIYPNYFTDEEDLDMLVKAIRKTIQFSEAESLKKFGSKLHNTPIPECGNYEFGSDEYWKCTLRQMTYITYNQCGTCKMGPPTDPDAVVDPVLKVMGLWRLRVVGAASIPEIPSCFIKAAVMMQAEKAADLIKLDWGY